MPVVRGFHLLAAGKRLAEQAILIVEAIAGRRLADRCHRVEEAGRQAAQAAVTQRRIDLLLQQIGEVDIVAFQHLAHLLIPAEVQQVVAGQTANQELHRDIVYVALAFYRLRRGLGVQQFGERAANGLPPLARGHLFGGNYTNTLPLTRQCSLKLCFVKGRL